MPDDFRQNDKILRVEKALYGHRQSPKDWFDCYTTELKKLNFKSISEEKCYWSFGNKIILFFYVDGSIMAFRKDHKSKAMELLEKLCERFPIVKLGEAKSFLGIKILRDRA